MGTTTKKVYEIGCAVVRDDIPLIDMGDGYHEYCKESIAENPNHDRTGMIQIVDHSAPEEFLKGEEIRFTISDLNLTGTAKVEGNFTIFNIKVPTTGFTHLVITMGDNLVELPYSIVKYIQELGHPDYSDIEQFLIGYVV